MGERLLTGVDMESDEMIPQCDRMFERRIGDIDSTIGMHVSRADARTEMGSARSKIGIEWITVAGEDGPA